MKRPQRVYSTVQKIKPIALAPFGERVGVRGGPAVVFGEDSLSFRGFHGSLAEFPVEHPSDFPHRLIPELPQE